MFRLPPPRFDLPADRRHDGPPKRPVRPSPESTTIALPRPPHTGQIRAGGSLLIERRGTGPLLPQPPQAKHRSPRPTHSFSFPSGEAPSLTLPSSNVPPRSSLVFEVLTGPRR